MYPAIATLGLMSLVFTTKVESSKDLPMLSLDTCHVTAVLVTYIFINLMQMHISRPCTIFPP